MFFPRSFALATLLAVAGCTDQSLNPTAQPADLRLSRYDAEEYEIRDIGTFGGQPTQGLDIDKHGTVYGRYGSPPSQRSYKWTESGGFEDLGDIDGFSFQILTANDHGLLNGSVFMADGQRGAAWVPGTGFVLIDPDFRGSTLGNNDRGVVAGRRIEPGGGSSAYVWSIKDGLSIVPVRVENASSIGAGAADVNNFDVVAGQVSFVSDGKIQSRAFIWDEATGTTIIPPLGPFDVGVTYVSDAGLVVGASHMRRPLSGETSRTPLASNPGTIPVHAWKWSAAEGLTDLGTLGGDHSVAWNADRDGDVYGWASDAAGVQHAVKWPASGGIVDLGGLGGNTVTGGLNKHGVVVGGSAASDGISHAIVFTPKKR